jgi:hypothetical protein
MLAGPITLSWLPATNQGVMVGDYISTSFISGGAKGTFAVASVPSGGLFDEATFVPASVLTVSGGTVSASAVVVSTSSDHPDPAAPATAN